MTFVIEKIAYHFSVSDPKNLVVFPWHNWCDCALKTVSFVIICPSNPSHDHAGNYWGVSGLIAPWLPETARKLRLAALTRWQEKLPPWASVFSIPSPSRSSVFTCRWIVRERQQWAPKAVLLVLPLLYCGVLSLEVLSQLTYLRA